MGHPLPSGSWFESTGQGGAAATGGPLGNEDILEVNQPFLGPDQRGPRTPQRIQSKTSMGARAFSRDYGLGILDRFLRALGR